MHQKAAGGMLCLMHDCGHFTGFKSQPGADDRTVRGVRGECCLPALADCLRPNLSPSLRDDLLIISLMLCRQQSMRCVLSLRPYNKPNKNTLQQLERSFCSRS
eukprot:767429-Hanusia_phi.AAC.2